MDGVLTLLCPEEADEVDPNDWFGIPPLRRLLVLTRTRRHVNRDGMDTGFRTRYCDVGDAGHVRRDAC